MSKVVCSLLCDFVIPGVGGTVYEALIMVGALVAQMKENEAVCRRVYDRLRFVWEELQKITDANLMNENRVLPMYGAAIARFLDFMQKHSRKRMLRRLAESFRVAERVQAFHDEIDELFKLLSIVHMAEMSAWRQQWAQDRAVQQYMLREVLSEARCSHMDPEKGSSGSSTSTITSSVCSSDSESEDENEQSQESSFKQKIKEQEQPEAEFMNTEQRLVVHGKELEMAIREHIDEHGYDVCGVLRLLRSLPSPHLALRGAAVLHELEVQLQPEVLCLALPSFVCELMTASAGKQTASFSRVRAVAERCWLTWFTPHVRALVQGRGVLIENVASSELLFSSSNELKFDSAWRRVLTWTGAGGKWSPCDDELEAQWRLVPENEQKTLFRIVNFRYPYEYLFATDVRCTGTRGTHALTSSPACSQADGSDTSPEALWELRITSLGGSSMETYSLFNPHTGCFLFTGDAKLDLERRLVLTIQEKSVDTSGAPTMRQCMWRLHVCDRHDGSEDGDRNSLNRSQNGRDRRGSTASSEGPVPEAARELTALEIVIKDQYEASGRDMVAVIDYLRALADPKHTLFGCSIAWSLDREEAHDCPSRRQSLVLPFFVYELTRTLPAESDAKVLADQYWRYWFSPVVKTVVLERGVLLENGSSNAEVLFSPENKHKLDGEHRPVTTWTNGNSHHLLHGSKNPKWTPGADELEAQWQFVPANAARTLFRVVNFRYPYETLRAAGATYHHGGRLFSYSYAVTSRGSDDRPVASPVGGNAVGQSVTDDVAALWELHAVGTDAFELFHPQQQAFLSSTGEMLDSHRRLALMARDTGDQDLAKLRRWRFRCLPGLCVE